MVENVVENGRRRRAQAFSVMSIQFWWKVNLSKLHSQNGCFLALMSRLSSGHGTAHVAGEVPHENLQASREKWAERGL